MSSPISLTIEKLIPGGEGLARHDGRVVFVAGVLPGEEVTVEITEAKKDFARARLVEIVKASPDRVAPACPVAGSCGGCDWLHIDAAAQARQKIELVRDSLRRMAGFDWPQLEIETGAPFGYRNRIQAHTDGSGKLGFLERGGHGFVPVSACPVAHASLQPLLAEGTRSRQQGRFLAFGHSDPAGSPRLHREDKDPNAEVEITILDKKIRFPLKGFFQSNVEMMERLIPYALEGLAGKVALDLYAGVGLFGAFLGNHFERVVCIEFNHYALRYAKQNVPGNDNEFLAEPVEKVVELRGNPLAQERADAAVIDPPREGLDKAVRAWLRDKPVEKLVYVSCNPVTLARDLKDLLAGPYELTDLKLFDFYPQTSHIEAVAKLKLRNP
jgi:23S rRNA (uracil1939-C5)-methyltransferase